jgi:hypothetical protein
MAKETTGQFSKFAPRILKFLLIMPVPVLLRARAQASIGSSQPDTPNIRCRVLKVNGLDLGFLPRTRGQTLAQVQA